MSDYGRKDLTRQQLEENIPRQDKTMGERVKEKVTDGVDRVKAAITPDSRKSATQQQADMARGQRKHHGRVSATDNLNGDYTTTTSSAGGYGLGGGAMGGSSTR